jgi:DNA-binding PadR family transcriptional regulator
LNDSELLNKIRSATTPLTADEVGKLVGSLRHQVTPLLRGMAASGLIEQLMSEGGGPVRFRISSKGSAAAAPAEQFTDNVVDHPTLRRKDDKASAKAKETEPKAKTKKAETATAPASKRVATTEAKAPATQGKKAQTAPQVQASINLSGADDRSPRERILMLLNEPMKREDILRVLGAMGDTLQEMITAGEVASEYIINDHVFELTDKGSKALKELIAKAPAEPVVAAPAPEPVAKAPVVEAPVVAPTAPVAAPVVQEQPVAPVVAEAPAPAPVAQKVEKAPDQPAKAEEAAAPSVSAALENPVMQELAKLVEKLVAERLADMTQQLDESKKDRQKLAHVAQGLKKVTAALQAGIDALNEVSDLIAE